MHYNGAMSENRITVKFFASLRDRLGKSECVLETEKPLSLAAVWDSVNNNEPMPENVLMAINMDYAKADTEAKPGDEVAFFPPVTGG